MKVNLYYTSPGGRVFALVAAALLLLMTFGAWLVAADALGDGQVSIRLRGGGRLSPSGWRAHLYGAGVSLAGLSFMSIGTACAAAAQLSSKWAARSFPLVRAGAILLVAAGGMAIVFTLTMLFK